ncbi:Hypothetical_protein [Hexamita inflata]|uniref:Hypothetical_protein n=1 Tax=Hexamita inflata TaxID=28002 RepID=A0AA86NV71_9EUKA|nr:Hypothetical protein HINF_LOCUS14455 [Hexamita inflata]
MHQKDGNDKNKRGRRCLGKVNQFTQQTQAVLKRLYSLHFGSNGRIHKILYQSELVISLVQDVPVISKFQSTKLTYERFYLENIWQLSLIGEKNKRIQQLVYGRNMQFITSSASTGPAEDLGVHLQLGQSKRFQVFLNHEKQWRTFSFNLNRELKMKFGYIAQLELQFRQLQSLSFSKYKQ